MFPPDKPLKQLNIVCGEGRNAVFFARNGHLVTAFDLSKVGVEKTKTMADKTEVSIQAFVENLNEYRLTEKYDILFSILLL